MNPCFVSPAYQAARTLARVVGSLPAHVPVVVVDDGSDDDTRRVLANFPHVHISTHPRNLGKGAALRTGLSWAHGRGHNCAVTLDADGQHPADAIRAILDAPGGAETLVLGVRNLQKAGAPRANRFSNWVSNTFLSLFARRGLRDTQCGLRRYPLPTALQLGASANGFAFEAEVLLRAAQRGVPIAQVPVDVLYPKDRTSHFDSWRDPPRIITTVLRTALVGAPSGAP